jgi:hypothetical protein
MRGPEDMGFLVVYKGARIALSRSQHHHQAFDKMSPQPYVFPESASPQLEVIQDYFKYVAIFDFEKLSTLITEDFVQKTGPASLGVPDRTKAELFAALAQLRDTLNGVPFEVSRLGLRYPICRYIIPILHDRAPCTKSTTE